jgi:hypothetical protein
LAITVIRGHTSTGSGGAPVTPGNFSPWGPASGSTVARNNTSLASAGSPATVIADTFNIQAAYKWSGGDDPELRDTYGDGHIYLSPSQRLVVRITAPADGVTSYGTLVFEEIGKPGN